jgi:hypothetical protein
MTCGALVERMRAKGITVDEIDPADWIARARARTDDADIAMAVCSFSRKPELDLFRMTNVDFAIEQTATLLGTMGIVMQPLDLVRAALELL